ncbi:MAG TPA: hypothetical protein VFT99_13150 [Roseiflexaceae bacterium]|nr:hypothetical protein [Roseiflexaceae bacterium]
MIQQHQCPVCGYGGLRESPHAHTFEICPCCGIEFGYDDATSSHAELRAEWIAAGAHWWSEYTPPPPNWNAADQLRVFEVEP